VAKKTVCLYLDPELVEEAAKLAEERNMSLSGLAEEVLRLYVAFSQLRPGRRPPPPQGNVPLAPPPPPPPPQQLPPHLQNNPWVSVLRSRQ
jgi:hypothetical protein